MSLEAPAQDHSGLTEDEWREWRAAARAGSFALGQPHKEKTRLWLERVLAHAFLQSNDAAVWLAASAAVAARIDDLGPVPDDTHLCCLTHQRADLHRLVCHMLEEDGQIRPSIRFTVHRRLITFLRALAYCGLVWRNLPRDEHLYRDYSRCCAYVESVLNWVAD